MAFEEGGCTVLRLQIHKIRNILIKEGIIIVNTPEDANACIVGTCAAFEADEIRSSHMIDDFIEKNKDVYAYGCMCNVNPTFIRTHKQYMTWEAQDLIKDICGHNVEFNYRMRLPGEFSSKEEYRKYDLSKRFLCITFGCSFNCSYCPHKLGVGSPLSIYHDEIINQIYEYNLNPDIKTIYITGTDTACYGFESDTNFAELLAEILSILRKDIKLRISQYNPEGIFQNSDLLFQCLKNPQIDEFQLPFQTASQRLLKLMNRNYDINKVGFFLEKLIKINPNLYIRTDILVGFPTETDKDIQKTLQFAIKYFSEIAIYIFEIKQNTDIIKMHLPEVPQNEKKRRYAHCKAILTQNNLLFHSGGQALETLIKCERKKMGEKL